MTGAHTTAAQGGGSTGTRQALAFISALRGDPALAESLVLRGSLRDLDAVVDVAAEAGFVIGVDDVRTAFPIDWGLRRARHQEPLSS